MIHETIRLSMEGSMSYARLITYIQEDYEEIPIADRPLVVICPGGAYQFTSDREGEPLAMQFLAMGYHAAVLKYSCAPAVFPTALMELAYSIRLIRQHAQEWHVNPNQVIVLGCSAGGHLAASLGVFWDKAFLAEALEVGETDRTVYRPDGMILCYPVITSGEFAHRGSFDNLLGGCAGGHLIEHLLRRTFLWHTFTDTAVPVENSLLFISALHRAGVSAEFHMYPRGVHGLSLANRLSLDQAETALQEECASWISLVHTWIEGRFQTITLRQGEQT